MCDLSGLKKVFGLDKHHAWRLSPWRRSNILYLKAGINKKATAASPTPSLFDESGHLGLASTKHPEISYDSQNLDEIPYTFDLKTEDARLVDQHKTSRTQGKPMEINSGS